MCLFFLSFNYIESKLLASFVEAIKITLRYEGGWFEAEKTYKGVMQGTYNAYRISHKLPTRDVREITNDELYDCYYERYYKRGHCDTLSAPMMIVHLDACVNFGVGGASKLLRRTYELVDLIKTLPKVLVPFVNINIELSEKFKAMLYCDIRIKKRYEIVESKPTKKKFLRGWIRRDTNLKKIIIQKFK